MKDGFVKVAAVTPKIRVADTVYNGKLIREYMKTAAEAGAKVVVFPELCVTGYTCGDLFAQDILLEKAKEEVILIARESEKYDGIFFIGFPYEWNGKRYNMAAAVANGKMLGLVPKTYLPNYNEFYEVRHFTSGSMLTDRECVWEGSLVPVGTNLIFYSPSFPKMKIAVELCEDLWTPEPPSIRHARAGANVIVNLSASNEITGKRSYRRSLVSGQSARLICGYLYASAGDGESTQDVVYSGHNLIAENGHILAESAPFSDGIIGSEIDVNRLEADRKKMTTFANGGEYTWVPFALSLTETALTRYVDPHPFVPSDSRERAARCEEILTIQAMGLKKRIEHTGCRNVVVGISGGLDSTLALLVTVRAFDLLQMDRLGILAVTMPGFGTTGRTYENAVSLIRRLNAAFMEVNICEAVNIHLRDIAQDSSVHDVTYENAQARERTQILMDLANKCNGMVIGTGDLSELALGWATYNGDHMSMYAVNSSIPKTLVRHLVRCYADGCGDKELSRVLEDILDTPVSPELLPPKEGEISQKTEDLVGPYELHDFFLYYMLRFGFAPEKIARLAFTAFAGMYEESCILKWLRVFYKRFFSQQFKRSCLPDGPKVGSIAVSPRGDLRMPSDACGTIWLEEIDRLSKLV